MERMTINKKDQDKIKEDKLVDSMVPLSGTSDLVEQFKELGFDQAIDLCTLITMSIREHEAEILEPISNIGLLH